MHKNKLNQDNKVEAKRVAILNSALSEFIKKGFNTTRIEDIAKQAGVAKGTIYLYFNNKNTLFEEVIRQNIKLVLNTLNTTIQTNELKAQQPEGHKTNAHELLQNIMLNILGTLQTTNAGDALRLLIREGLLFPELTAFYHQEFITPILNQYRYILKKAYDNKEIKVKELSDYPQILVAPLVFGIIWQTVFSNKEPINLEEMLKVHLKNIFIK
ncbi:TetR/AcrR family transcriptional regulator [Desulfovibrio litoralis]|uniref:Transcriptional regulator, TetR family n=1 Tax=Desulfovibrio litoralis DSM 11393 TaxID=1121455 RepID=A0A1M7SPZ3_9BACT|nr:TetR/AcrR family transcriptional regulator [Desulfovibrio litoralis]SHN60504.1 transcriptional regulator, TetR family [Desulfovibrio litoralis DSM 11393]